MSQLLEETPLMEIAQPFEYPHELPEDMGPDQWLSLYSNVLHDIDRLTEGGDPVQREALRDIVELTAFKAPGALWGIYDSMRDSEGKLKTKTRTMNELLAERDQSDIVEEIFSRPSFKKDVAVDNVSDPKKEVSEDEVAKVNRFDLASEKIKQFKNDLLDFLFSQNELPVAEGGPPKALTAEQSRLVGHAVAMRGVLRTMSTIVGFEEMPTVEEAYNSVVADNNKLLESSSK